MAKGKNNKPNLDDFFFIHLSLQTLPSIPFLFPLTIAHRVHGRLAVGAYPGFVFIGPGLSFVGDSGEHKQYLPYVFGG